MDFDFSDVRQVFISTHAPLAGRDGPDPGAAGVRHGDFNPRAPCGARRRTSDSSFCSSRNFNPRAPCGARQFASRLLRYGTDFNPRAPCGARQIDTITYDNFGTFQPTRPLRGATDVKSTPPFSFLFQPTRPLRGATVCPAAERTTAENFNPRAPCGARRLSCFDIIRRFWISTHAPLAGRDGQSRQMVAGLGFISTHAPLAGRDGQRL